jgi:hypothetical protein
MPVIARDKRQSEYTKIVSSKHHKVILKRDSSRPVDFYRWVGALRVVLDTPKRRLELKLQKSIGCPLTEVIGLHGKQSEKIEC